VRLVDRMTQNPPVCLHCGSGNVEDHAGQIPRAIDLEREVNWGDSTYLCEKCGMLVAGLLDFISPDDYKELERTIASQKKQLHEVKAMLHAQKRRTTAILEGKKAIRAERAARGSAVQ
jgi:hypothetical protein